MEGGREAITVKVEAVLPDLDRKLGQHRTDLIGAELGGDDSDGRVDVEKHREKIETKLHGLGHEDVATMLAGDHQETRELGLVTETTGEHQC